MIEKIFETINFATVEEIDRTIIRGIIYEEIQKDNGCTDYILLAFQYSL